MTSCSLPFHLHHIVRSWQLSRFQLSKWHLKFCCFFQHCDGHLRSPSIFRAGIKTGKPFILYWKRWKNTLHLLLFYFHPLPSFPFFFLGSFLLKYTGEFSSFSSKVRILYMFLSLSLRITWQRGNSEEMMAYWSRAKVKCKCVLKAFSDILTESDTSSRRHEIAFIPPFSPPPSFLVPPRPTLTPSLFLSLSCLLSLSIRNITVLLLFYNRWCYVFESNANLVITLFHLGPLRWFNES